MVDKMNRKMVLVELVTDINEVIRQPLQFTQRIKFTCFNVSKHYVIFGATSGGVYIFNRHPCKFVKLIPSKEGSVQKISVAADEKTIALSSVKGLIVVLENCFDDLNLQYSVFSEHEGAIVTAMKWLRNELYCGDNTGKVSVITLNNLLAKAMFQTPSASLMQLDSPVIQIDTYSHFLLISTQTRSYLCNTEKEQYRQIGKKLRDGPFGACFFNTGIDIVCSEPQTSIARGLFKTLKDDEIFSDSNECDVKIFVARPGARLWEVSFEASVTYTHQFRDSLNKNPTDIIHWDENTDAHLHISSNNSELVPESFNFEKIYPLLDKYIFTFKKDGFYIFSPEKVSLEYWSSHFTNIKDVKICKEYLYIWDEVQINVVALVDVEYLILKTLFKNQFKLCSELCLLFQDDIFELIPFSNRIHLVLTLKNELEKLNCDAIVQQLKPIFDKLEEESYSNKIVGQKLRSGIVVIDNTHNVKSNICETTGDTPIIQTVVVNSTCKINQDVNDTNEQIVFSTNTVNDPYINEQITQSESDRGDESTTKVEDKPVNTPPDINPASLISYNIKILYEQYQFNKIHSNLQTSTLEELLKEKDLAAVVDLFKVFISYGITLKDEEDKVKMWCYDQCLRHFSNADFSAVAPDSKVFSFIVECFKNVNKAQNNCCCVYPTPNAKNKKVLFYEIGCEIIKKSPDFEDILKGVPYMWKFVITNLWYQNDVSTLLPLIVQYSDENVFSLFLNRLTYDDLDDAIKLLIKLKSGVCLNCDSKMKVTDSISWTNFGLLMMQSIGGLCSMKLMQTYANFIPNRELTQEFYKTCLFASTVDGFKEGVRKESTVLATQLLSDEKTKEKFSVSLEKYLHQKYTKASPNVINQMPRYEDINVCPCCELPLNIPILNDICKLKCGHSLHKICFTYNKETCIFCNVIS